MIRFACPRCKSILEQPENAGGSKVACPKCSQRLQVPLPPTSKTILGDLVTNAGAPPPVSEKAAGSPAPFDAQLRLVNGREILAWYCPLCQNQVEVALDLGQKTIRCPHCAKRINVPTPGPPASSSGSDKGMPPLPGPAPLPVASFATPAAPVAPPPLPPAESYVPTHPGTVLGDRLDDDEPRRPRRRRGSRWDYDDDDYDEPFRRRPIRYERGYSTWAATAGFVCSMISVGILLVCFVLWIIALEDRRWNQSGEAWVFVFLLGSIGSFILGILGVVFSSRGLDGSNNYNRGMAVAGLICGIIGLVLGVIFAIPFLLCGWFFWAFRWR